ncbi:MAG: hypothetical protein QXO40_04060, partial [Candidatus Aenigmatarchaeota archaeon]
MFFKELIISDSFSENFNFNKAYNNFKIKNDGLEEVQIYNNEALIGIVKPDEELTFKCYKIENLRFKTNQGFSIIRI